MTENSFSFCIFLREEFLEVYMSFNEQWQDKFTRFYNKTVCVYFRDK